MQLELVSGKNANYVLLINGTINRHWQRTGWFRTGVEISSGSRGCNNAQNLKIFYEINFTKMNGEILRFTNIAKENNRYGVLF